MLKGTFNIIIFQYNISWKSIQHMYEMSEFKVQI